MYRNKDNEEDSKPPAKKKTSGTTKIMENNGKSSASISCKTEESMWGNQFAETEEQRKKRIALEEKRAYNRMNSARARQRAKNQIADLSQKVMEFGAKTNDLENENKKLRMENQKLKEIIINTTGATIPGEMIMTSDIGIDASLKMTAATVASSFTDVCQQQQPQQLPSLLFSLQQPWQLPYAFNRNQLDYQSVLTQILAGKTLLGQQQQHQQSLATLDSTSLTPVVGGSHNDTTRATSDTGTLVVPVPPQLLDNNNADDITTTPQLPLLGMNDYLVQLQQQQDITGPSVVNNLEVLVEAALQPLQQQQKDNEKNPHHQSP